MLRAWLAGWLACRLAGWLAEEMLASILCFFALCQYVTRSIAATTSEFDAPSGVKRSYVMHGRQQQWQQAARQGEGKLLPRLHATDRCEREREEKKRAIGKKGFKMERKRCRKSRNVGRARDIERVARIMITISCSLEHVNFILQPPPPPPVSSDSAYVGKMVATDGTASSLSFFFLPPPPPPPPLSVSGYEYVMTKYGLQTVSRSVSAQLNREHP
jgi:hypothetical protein